MDMDRAVYIMSYEGCSSMLPRPYRDYGSYLRGLFGCRVQKISLDAGLTCPNRDGKLGHGGCIYCNGRGSGTGASRRSQSIAEQISDAKPYLRARYGASKFLAYFQSFSNTYAPLPVLRAMFEQALADQDIAGLSIGTRPDCLAHEALEYLGKLSAHRYVCLELGLQSANNTTLACIRRGHGVEAFEDAVRRTRVHKIPICVHIILGLPGETRDDMVRTAQFIASQDIQAIKIHTLYVVKDTELEQLYLRGEYRCLSREEYVAIAAEVLSHLRSDIVIQRLTGDPHPDELVAPPWTLEKRANLAAIHAYMHERGLYQGKALENRDEMFSNGCIDTAVRVS